MLKNVTKLEVKIGERLYHFLCEVDSPIGEVHDVLSSMKAFVIQRMQEAQKAQEAGSDPEEG